MIRPKIFDSNEEWYVSWWIDELIKEGYVESVEYQPAPFELYDGFYREHIIEMKRVPDKVEFQTIMHPHIYTCDAKIVWTDKADGVFYFHEGMYGVKKDKHLLYATLEDVSMVSYLEVKPSFDRHNMTRLAVLNTKWVHSLYKVVVEIIKPETLFKTTFTPERYLLTDRTYEPRKLKYKPQTLNQFIDALLQEKRNNR